MTTLLERIAQQGFGRFAEQNLAAISNRHQALRMAEGQVPLIDAGAQRGIGPAAQFAGYHRDHVLDGRECLPFVRAPADFHMASQSVSETRPLSEIRPSC